jgi:hypothetical protein
MRFKNGILTAAAALLAITSAACGSDLTLPNDDQTGSPTGSTGLTTLDSTLASGGIGRVEIKLFPGEMVAREFHVESDDDEEQLAGRVTAIDPARGTITLELGGLVVSYGDGTRFRTDDESHESRANWEAAVQARLAAGGRPLVEARRNPIGASQSPDDGAFAARDFRLEDDDDDQKIEIYLDQDNVVSQGDGSIVLRVLGLTIEVNGRTRLFDDKGGAGSGGDDNDDNGGDDHGSDDD